MKPRPTGLDALFTPTTVAVIGASDDPARIGGRVLKRFIDYFPGTILAVNARRDTVQGRPCYRSVGELPEPPDLAVLAIPSDQVVEAVERLAERGCGLALILSSGFGELGPEGKREQDKLADIARRSGMRIVGPNCVGAASLPQGLLATFADLAIGEVDTSPGPGVGVVSQSGALGARFFQDADARGLRVTYMCTTGNEADVTAAEVIAALIERPDVHTVMAFLEGLQEPEVLYAAGCRALELGKPIIAMKVGVSKAGAMAAASHSGSLAAPDRLAQALFDRAGIIRADSPTDLVDLTAAFAGRRLPAGNRIAVMTLSGGVGVMIADEADRWELTLPSPSAETKQRIGQYIPAFGSTRNPIDYTANAVNNPAGFEEILKSVAADDNFDMICISGLSMATVAESTAAIRRSADAGSKPVIVSVTDPATIRMLNAHGVPCVEDPVHVARGLGALWRYRMVQLADRAEPPALGAAPWDGGEARTLSADETRSLLSAYGVPFIAEIGAKGAAEATAAAGRLGYPVAVKLDPSVAAHKTEIGGVRLGLRNKAEVYEAATELQEALGTAEDVTVVVQRMAEQGIELTLGATRDAKLGPAVLIGLGGVLVEILDEIELGLVPVGDGEAQRMVRRLCGGRLAQSGRGLTGDQVRSLSRAIVGMSTLMQERRDLVEIDVNPVIATSGGLVAVDGLIRAESAPLTDGQGTRAAPPASYSSE